MRNAANRMYGKAAPETPCAGSRRHQAPPAVLLLLPALGVLCDVTLLHCYGAAMTGGAGLTRAVRPALWPFPAGPCGLRPGMRGVLRGGGGGPGGPGGKTGEAMAAPEELAMVGLLSSMMNAILFACLPRPHAWCSLALLLCGLIPRCDLRMRMGRCGRHLRTSAWTWKTRENEARSTAFKLAASCGWQLPPATLVGEPAPALLPPPAAPITPHACSHDLSGVGTAMLRTSTSMFRVSLPCSAAVVLNLEPHPLLLTPNPRRGH